VAAAASSFVIVREQVELLDVDQDRLGVRRRDPLPCAGAAAGAATGHVAQEVQHQVPDPGGADIRPRLAVATSGQEGIQHGQREHSLAEGRQAQQPGFKCDLAVPLRDAAMGR
jgi:hypothetical protein